MTATMRVSKPGYNALNDANIYNYSIYADGDNVLIKEYSRGYGTITLNDSTTINHNLGYIPLYFCYCEISTDRYRIANSFDPLGGGWRSYTTSSDFVIENFYSDTYTGYRYYLFYDKMD
jgi:hypothetical protein